MNNLSNKKINKEQIKNYNFLVKLIIIIKKSYNNKLKVELNFYIFHVISFFFFLFFDKYILIKNEESVKSKTD